MAEERLVNGKNWIVIGKIGNYLGDLLARKSRENGKCYWCIEDKAEWSSPEEEIPESLYDMLLKVNR